LEAIMTNEDPELTPARCAVPVDGHECIGRVMQIAARLRNEYDLPR
jgi:hypothetical protein